MGAVKLAGRLPEDDEVNGLPSISASLLDEPRTIRAGFCVFDVVSIREYWTRPTKDAPDGELVRVPTIRILKFEPLGDADDTSQEIRAAVLKRMEDRTGKEPLPFDHFGAVEDVN